jgi:site-specific DNA-methyltransferase (adenine-specific)
VVEALRLVGLEHEGLGVVQVTTLHHGDCRQVLAEFPDSSIDAIVTDPPYGLEFMGKDWDAPWQASSKSALFGTRSTTMPGFGSQRNATCLTCRGRLRGKTRCNCDVPNWDEAPSATNNRQMHAYQAWFTEIAAELYRVLKPGGHLLAFGGTRTYHRMAAAIEDAEFEIRDSLHWVYGSGFPKSLDVSKAIDKAAGAKREVVGSVTKGSTPLPNNHDGKWNDGQIDGTFDITAPATDAARQWDGWGTALKPAHEPIVVARKPLVGTVAANVLAHGTGALNIDGTRVGTTDRFGGGARATSGFVAGYEHDGWTPGSPLGRWPANFVLTHTADCADECVDGCPVAELDEQSGERPSGARRAGTYAGKSDGPAYGRFGSFDSDQITASTGGASRFFTVTEWDDVPPFRYVAKPSRSERNAGLDGLPRKAKSDDPYGYANARRGRCHGCARWADIGEGDDCSSCGTRFDRTANEQQPMSNHHPTVKPLALMRWLVRLVTPPGGVVLDPFAGSGTTLAAAVLEGFDAVGIEMTDEYLPIINGRVAWAEQQVANKAPTLFTEEAS